MVEGLQGQESLSLSLSLFVAVHHLLLSEGLLAEPGAQHRNFGHPQHLRSLPSGDT